MRIGINTGGGDAPGLNAVIHAVVLSAHHRGWEVVGIQTGYGGLIDPRKTVRLTPAHVESIVDRGGTILGTTNRADPFRFPVKSRSGEVTFEDLSDEVVTNFHALRLDVLVAVGGDGSMVRAAACQPPRSEGPGAGHRGRRAGLPRRTTQAGKAGPIMHFSVLPGPGALRRWSSRGQPAGPLRFG